MKRAFPLAAIVILLALATASSFAQTFLEPPHRASVSTLVLGLMSDQAHDLTAAHRRSATCPFLSRCRAVKFDIADHSKQDDEHSPAVRMRRRLLVETRHERRARLQSCRFVARWQVHHRTRMIRRSWTHGRRPGKPPHRH